MKIKGSKALASLAWLAWGIAAIVAVAEMTSVRALALAVGAGATLTIYAVALACTARIIAAVDATAREHAERMEKATAKHAELLSKHVLALDHFFGMGVKSDVLAKVDLAETRAMNGTGPFAAHNRKAS